MRSTITLLLLIPLTSTTVAVPSDSLYGNWCDNQATTEQVPPEERAKHITACIETLEEVDRNPNAGNKNKDDEEG